MRKKYYITLRKRKGNTQDIYYIRFCNDNGEVFANRSAVELYRLLSRDQMTSEAEILRKHVNTRTKVENLAQNALMTGVIGTRPKAILKAEEVWTAEDIEEQKEIDNSPLFITYCRHFWDYDTSVYLQKRKAEGDNITRVYADKQITLIDNHVVPFLHSRGLDDITLKQVKPSMAEQLKESMLVDKKLSVSVVNSTLTAIRKPLKEAKVMGLIEDDVAALISNAKNGKARRMESKKGIPTSEEVKKMLRFLDTTYPTDWYRYKYLVVAIAVQTGMREAEITMLKPQDFSLMSDGQSYCIHTARAFNRKDGEKTTKNGEERDCTCSKALGDQILAYGKSCPVENGFLFYSLTNPEQQLRIEAPNEAFKEGLKGIGIDEEERKERKLTFHSLRHFHATFIAQEAGKETAKIATGHKSDQMVTHYTDHQTEEKIRKLDMARKTAIDTLFEEAE